MTITGTIAQINALLNTDGTSTVSFIDNTDNPAATRDAHADRSTTTAIPAAVTSSSSDTATINITAVNDAPVATVPQPSSSHSLSPLCDDRTDHAEP